MAVNFVTVDRDTPDLLPASVQEYLPQDHLARFVVEIVDQAQAMRRQRQQIDWGLGQVDGEFAGGLRGIDMQQHPAVFGNRGDLRDGLHDPCLVVGVLASANCSIQVQRLKRI